MLIAFALTAGAGVSRPGLASAPEGFGGALLEEPSFLGLPRGFGAATSWPKMPPMPPASLRSAAAFSSALAGFRRMCPASMSSAVGCLRGLPRLRGGSFAANAGDLIIFSAGFFSRGLLDCCVS